jgi:hypothetical protein
MNISLHFTGAPQRAPMPMRSSLWTGSFAALSIGRAVARRIILAVLAVVCFASAARLQAQTVAIQPSQRSIHSGIATNRWLALGTTNGTTVKSVIVGNPSATAFWVYVFDSNGTNVVDGTSTNRAAWSVAAGTVTYWNPPDGEAFNNGVLVSQSTTYPTLTNSSAATAALVVTVKHTP